MPQAIEDYALIGNLHTAGLVGLDGSIDWLCLPRFDSGACFASLLGHPEHGRWLLGPAGGGRVVRRAYREDTLVLETEYATGDGQVRLTDWMPLRDGEAEIARRVEGVRGRVRLRCELVPAFDYGHIVPWLRREGRRVQAFAGPDTLTLTCDVELSLADGRLCGEFELSEGRAADFHLVWTPLGREPRRPDDLTRSVEETTRWWRDWAGRCAYEGPYRDAVVRSLITLKALTYAPSGGVVAAPTTSLPERIGGTRNWDYRYCWIRDATFTLKALLEGGYAEEAVAWRDWLLRAVAGRPEQMQILYGVTGERRLLEIELPWLPGYADSAPVRIGNSATDQLQLDMYGELMDAMHQARRYGMAPDDRAWEVQRDLLEFLESNWRRPDRGIWEIRGPCRQFTSSKVMAWVAADRAVQATERLGLEGPVDRWRRLREDISTEVCAEGYNAERRTFTQYYGGKDVDAALLRMAPVGFLPADDERMRGTVAAIESELGHQGLLRRYDSDSGVDGLPPGESAFLACSFWLADNYLLQGRAREARALFERLIALRNDVGLLSEEYDPYEGRMTGNFPQALSHIPLVGTALGLASQAPS
ncbi:glycoside hydrolase family 15 protein [Microtetraspora fusca]|uniref:Glycoside hydrolase family 15 protein n=1 Tax=Microtetraspora fusca TaxID=1997 RepID=A0ABW6V1I3_MICFU